MEMRLYETSQIVSRPSDQCF